jgi:hypothetical protein
MRVGNCTSQTYICAMASDFWRDRVVNIVGTDPRDRHCPHRLSTEYVVHTGVPSKPRAHAVHLHVAVDRAACTCYMRSRQNQWLLDSVQNALHGFTNPMHCAHCDTGTIEDRLDLLLKSMRACMRCRFSHIFATHAAQRRDRAAWSRDNDHTEIAHCISGFYTMRFPASNVRH